jgi:putative hydrolase
MTPVESLERVVHCLDRAFDNGHRAKAFSRALAVLRETPADEIVQRAAAGTLSELASIGDSTAKIITEAVEGKTPDYLTKLEAETVVPITPAGAEIRALLKGDLHSHSTWSDGGAEIDNMVATAKALGHDYLLVSDHSPRLTVAHGLNRERLENQLKEVAELNRRHAPFRILCGMEVDINLDGSLDLDDDLLQRLDIVVASVHSKLAMPEKEMTARMMLAVASPHVDILGHCTGRHLPKRGPSAFDADYVFAACASYGTAVEINCRPERLDPPPELLAIALSYDCLFSINSDAHATGQLEWQPHGCDIAAAGGVPTDRIINTWSVEKLLAWAGSK